MTGDDELAEHVVRRLSDAPELLMFLLGVDEGGNEPELGEPELE